MIVWMLREDHGLREFVGWFCCTYGCDFAVCICSRRKEMILPEMGYCVIGMVGFYWWVR